MKMKHLLLPLMFVPLMFISCGSDDGDSPNSGNNGKTYLAEITVREHSWKFGERSEYGELYESYKYDALGRMTENETNHYSALLDGRNNYRYTYTYDERNRVVEKNEYWMTILNYKYKYQYNEFDSIAAMQKYNEEGRLYEDWTYEYDSNRKLLKATEKGSIIDYVHTYQYDGNKVTEVTNRLDNGELFGTFVWEYDSHKNLLTETWINGETGKQTVQVDNSYEYDANGKLKKKTSKDYILKDHLTYREYYYNADGTIDKIHLSYSFKNDQSDLIYTYTWK